mgnify:CR=1 FL=1|tara:strand:+ start:203 stop:424 length:222 start_codon:yes stop_codon:yes gene_type:complete
MAKNKGIRKNLLKTDAETASNLSYENKVKIKSTVVVPAKPVKEKTKTPEVSDSHVQYVRARPTTPINQRQRNK